MANNINVPIPQNPIGENFAWRDWLQKLSNRVFGSLGQQDANAVLINGGSIDNTVIGSLTPSSGKFTSISLNSPLAVAYGGTNSSTVAGARTTLGVTATGADTTYAYRANNLSDLASVSTARTNLGVTATGSDTTYAYRANNLSDLASASTARTNLGLGTMATQNTGISTTVDLAKLTIAGSNGSLTVSNGIITAYTAPT